MAQDSDYERISQKAYELWESEGRPHGRDQMHWDEAKEIVALEDSMAETLMPRETGASEPEEPAIAVTNQGEMPNLTDQGADDLTSTDREPAVTQPKPRSAAAADTPAKDSSSTASSVTGRSAPAGSGGPVSVTQGKPGSRN